MVVLVVVAVVVVVETVFLQPHSGRILVPVPFGEIATWTRNRDLSTTKRVL